LTFTPVPTPVVTDFQFTDTPEPNLTPTETFSLAPTLLPTEFTDSKGVVMRLIPESDFIMGSENGFANERPVHIVHLGDYYIDVYEITNAAYMQCVTAGVCAPPLKLYSYSREDYYNNPKYDDYPVINVNWEMVNNYCVNWRGGQLPTEAEWEKAARGTDTRIYPWGDIFNGMYLNYCDFECDPKSVGAAVTRDPTYNDGYSDTSPVGNYPDGVSPYGIFDLAGNVWEWVYDWYGEYNTDSRDNPIGPSSGTLHILRGGGWNADKNLVRVTNRRQLASEAVSSVTGSIGFRCALIP